MCAGSHFTRYISRRKFLKANIGSRFPYALTLANVRYQVLGQPASQRGRERERKRENTCNRPCQMMIRRFPFSLEKRVECRLHVVIFMCSVFLLMAQPQSRYHLFFLFRESADRVRARLVSFWASFSLSFSLSPCRLLLTEMD